MFILQKNKQTNSIHVIGQNDSAETTVVILMG